MKQSRKRNFLLLWVVLLVVFFLIPVPALVPVHAKTTESTESTEPTGLPVPVLDVLDQGEDKKKALEIYQRLERGMAETAGIDGKSYIDLSELKLSNKDGSADRALLNKLFRLAVYNHPEFFYLTGSYERLHWKSAPEKLAGIRPFYYDFAKEPGAIPAFEKAVETALAAAEGAGSQLEQALLLHDYLAVQNTYNWQVATGHKEDAPKKAWNAYSALVQEEGSKGEGRGTVGSARMESETAGTVCRGYALAYRLLLNRLGIPCLAVGNREHVWNLIRLGDGNWYHVDVNAANNIVPTLRGRCRHSFFLLSDETLQALGQADGERVNSAYASWYAYSWQDGIESLWATEAPACMSKQFETGWAFCGRVDFPMYATERGYYAVRRVDAKECALYKYPAKGTALAGQGELLAALPLYTYAEDGRYYTRSGVVWQKDFLYYVNMEKELICHDLLTQEEISLGTVPFFAMPSYDRNYTRLNDGIGLYYDKEQQEIVAVSRSRRRELARFAAVFH